MSWIDSTEREGRGHGLGPVVARYDDRFEVRALPHMLPILLTRRNHYRDPTQHSKLKDEIEAQSTALYASARLWDDGIIRPVDTRDVVGLGLALAAGEKGTKGAGAGRWGTGENDLDAGFGVFRM